MPIKKIIFIISLFFSVVSFSSNKNLLNSFNWELFSNKDGLKIYRAQKHKATGIVPIKFEIEIPHTFLKVLSVLDDSSRKFEWVPQLERTAVIKQDGLFHKVEFSHYSSPWPLTDRTFLIDLKAKYYHESKTLKVLLHSIESPKAPINKKFVRAKTYIGDVSVKDLGDNKTKLEMILLTDFKGSIPSWVVNLVQKKWPKKFTTTILKQLSKNDIIINPDWVK